MTDFVTSGVYREVMVTDTGQLYLSGVVREVLVSTTVALIIAGVVREVLLTDARAGPSNFFFGM